MRDETAEQRRERLGLEEQTRKLGRTIADAVKSECGSGVGFLLVMFDFGEDGSMAYCSNGVRRDVIAMIDELKAKLGRPGPA